GPPALPALFAGLRSESACKQRTGTEGLQRLYCCQGPGFETPEVDLFVEVVLNHDPVIRRATGAWLDSLQGSALEKFEPEQVVEVLVELYKNNTPPPSMVEIARMLATYPSQRVNRFMRAAIHAPNPQIQKIARSYLAANKGSSETSSAVPPPAPVKLNTSAE